MRLPPPSPGELCRAPPLSQPPLPGPGPQVQGSHPSVWGPRGRRCCWREAVGSQPPPPRLACSRAAAASHMPGRFKLNSSQGASWAFDVPGPAASGA